MAPWGKVYRRWWEQRSLDLVGARAALVRAVEAEEEEEEYGSDTSIGT